MTWQFNPASWINGTTIPQVSDFQHIAADIHTWGGNVSAASYGLASAGFLTLLPGANPGTTYSISNATWSGSVAQLTIGAHQIQAGQLVVVSSILPFGYNGTFVVVAVGATTINYALTANPGSYSSGGAVQVDGTAPAIGMTSTDPYGNAVVWNGSAWQSGCAKPSTTVTLANGLNSNINIGPYLFVRVVGPTAAFSVGGFQGGWDGRELILYNTTAQPMTMVNADSSSVVANQIATLTGGNYTELTTCVIKFVYSVTDSAWLMQSKWISSIT